VHQHPSKRKALAKLCLICMRNQPRSSCKENPTPACDARNTLANRFPTPPLPKPLPLTTRHEHGPLRAVCAVKTCPSPYGKVDASVVIGTSALEIVIWNTFEHAG
jgi:hypothetical protein